MLDAGLHPGPDHVVIVSGIWMLDVQIIMHLIQNHPEWGAEDHTPCLDRLVARANQFQGTFS